ncbi:hypothetical protein VMCG_10079 [Cytospora schulzeri]|uniref:Uncharacterized protein n=1 Tax=Cytospora schulzeri TaxID=448051 RepID=A0A423VCM7_9PEZI|nr:hypothetical protein VMCG_10079 [Valsa malicola]
MAIKAIRNLPEEYALAATSARVQKATNELFVYIIQDKTQADYPIDQAMWLFCRADQRGIR